MTIYITSDHHFGHKNIIKYSHRPFKNVNQMNKILIQNWNKTVTADDIIYHLGDFALTSKKHAEKICKQLNGYKIIIAGNHDHGKKYMLDIGFDEYYKTILTIDNFILSHTPLFIENTPMLNVSVDNWNYTPIPFPTTQQQINLCGHAHDKWVTKI